MPNYGHASFGLNLLHAYLKWTPCTIYSVKADRQPTVHCNLYQISTILSDYLVTAFIKLLTTTIFRKNVLLLFFCKCHFFLRQINNFVAQLIKV